ILSIAGLDPSGGAGLLIDLATFKAYGLRELGVTSALTAQNPRRVHSVHPVKASFIKKQVETLLDEFKIDALKIGMLATAENARVVGRIIKTHNIKNVVLDPVLASTSGFALMEKNGLKEIKKLLKFVTVVTPNISEAEALTGRKISGISEMEDAAENIFKIGGCKVIITGGHLRGAPTDVFFDGKKTACFHGKRINAKRHNLHGTGCILSSAIAAGLAKKRNIIKTIEEAKRYLGVVIRSR
ncbi:MAG: bifunctional hydroxymethylpyrimidine kinase/phosphomethylpyrimidine kinase, partial [Deltaproteobacteria bacterium]|nr:bifunctional hydroxymethylpyrimidine kinase/phosphomethylpyrimidine kinase [Deltaproteobacteria bacterium]